MGWGGVGWWFFGSAMGWDVEGGNVSGGFFGKQGDCGGQMTRKVAFCFSE